MTIIEVKNITKVYGRNKVLDNLNLKIKKGEFILLVGANGSGKTTLIKGLLGLINFDSGTIRIACRKIAYVPERFHFPDFISLEEFLKLLLDLEAIEEILMEWELLEARKKEFRELSKGMKQKTLLLQALYGKKELLIFDEPLSGIDSRSVKQFITKLKELKTEGNTIIVSTHSPKYYEQIVDRKIKLEVQG